MQQEPLLLQLILNLLTRSKPPDNELIHKAISENPEFEQLYNNIIAIREMSYSIVRGDLSKNVSEKGFVISNLKALQSTLKHLTWQTRQITDGDFTQKVDFLGDFSDAFNNMVDKLANITTQLEDLARLDDLTKIPNRLSLNQFFKHEFSIAKYKNKELCVCIFDIDFFKRINDTYGHVAGDQILIQFADILSKLFRHTDIFGRYGGEEFMAILPDIQLEHVVKIAQRAIHCIETADFIIDEDRKTKITVSVGISMLRPDDQTYEDMIKRSDNALYIAKNSGKNCMIVFNDNMISA